MRLRTMVAALALLLICSTSFGGYYVTAYDECGRPYQRYVATTRKGLFPKLVVIRNGQQHDFMPTYGPASRQFSRSRARAAYTNIHTTPPRVFAPCRVCCRPKCERSLQTERRVRRCT